ncbi:TPA: 5'-methylthioadenosine/adenosylhomocysteine nucleosidase [Candidatus Woesearchaeota archaeon]|nr:5'-methylthioadenosine/adenosylhomocysteine nucleosidase [Candidatus Woesearchaeota archaeon]
MKIGIIGAMDEEIVMYKEHLVDRKEVTYKTLMFYTGKLQGKEVIVVKSGVGKVFAAMTCQYLIDRFNVNIVLFTGVGGSLNPILNIGDVVVSRDSAHHDFNATALGFPRGNISYTQYRFFKADTKLVELALKTKIGKHKIIAGRILTGDQFLTHKEKQEYRYLTEELKGDCVEMEGAAVAQVCVINEIPHLIVRTVSDKADGTAVQDYNQFFPIVANNSFKIVEFVVSHLKI